MSAIFRWTLPLIAYLCVGTVISALLGYGYLRKSGKLTDETMFRITALLHGIDLDALKAEGQKTVEGVPSEEPSFAEQQLLVHAQALRFDAKQKQLEDSLNNFGYQRREVTEQLERYKQLQSQVETYLVEQRDKLANADLEAVRAQLEALIPKKQGKPLLIKYIEAGEIETVIKLLNSVKDRVRDELLRTFDQEADIEMLYQIQKHMLNDNPAMQQINEQLEKLNQLNAQAK